MNKKGYNKAKKSNYNVKVVKNASLTDYFAKVKAEEKAQEKQIKSKADLYGLRKEELEYSLEYNEKYIRSHSGNLEDGWTEDCASHFSDMEIEKEALQRIQVQEEDLRQLDTLTARFETCADWLACKPEDIEKPVECGLWHFCRKQRTKEAMDCITFSASGKRQDTEYYRDYKQECLMHLYEYALEHPQDNFQEALYISIKAGLYSEWSKRHKQVKVKKPDGSVTTATRKIDSIDTPLDKEDSESASLKDALPDTYAKPLDYDLIQAEKCESVILTYTRNNAEEQIIKDIASGYTLKESAFYSGEKYDAVKKRYERMKAKAEAKAERRKAEAKAEAEKRKARAEAKAKAEAPKEPEAWTRTEAKPKVNCEYHLTEAEAIKRMFEKPLVYASVTDTSKRTKRTYVNAYGVEKKRIKPEAEVIHNAVKPEASKPKYSSYSDNEKLLKRIAEADKRKEEFAKYELENSSYCKKLYANI